MTYHLFILCPAKLFAQAFTHYTHSVQLPYFGPNVRLLFADLFRLRIRNVYIGSGSDPDPAKSFGSFRIRFRIRNTARNTVYSQPVGPVRPPYLLYRPARPHGLAESIPGLLKRLQIRALGLADTPPEWIASVSRSIPDSGKRSFRLAKLCSDIGGASTTFRQGSGLYPFPN
jgi:hypothetical protein